MAYLFLYGFPILVIAAAAGLGVGSASYFMGGIEPNYAPSAAFAISAGIPCVAGVAYAVSKSGGELRELYGQFLDYLSPMCLLAFVLGCVFGLKLPV